MHTHQSTGLSFSLQPQRLAAAAGAIENRSQHGLRLLGLLLRHICATHQISHGSGQGLRARLRNFVHRMRTVEKVTVRLPLASL